VSEALSSAVERTIRSTLAADIIIANAPDPVFVCDLEGKILEANEAVSRLLGLRRDEVLEQSISRFLGQDETREFVMALREVVERDVTRNVRLQPRSASGGMIPTTLNASALRDTDGNIIGILRDMRELDQARAYAESLIRGISPELLPHIFDHFQQDERTRRHGGLGLGLTIVRHIVELHEGSVRAESDGEGRGATLIVELPLPVDDVRPASRPPAGYRRLDSASSRLIKLAGRRILVVDDEADARDLLAQIFGQAGADVTVVASADEALECLQRWRPDVLVSDIAMPGDDGFALIRKVRALGPEEGGQVRAGRPSRADGARRRSGSGAATLSPRSLARD